MPGADRQGKPGVPLGAAGLDGETAAPTFQNEIAIMSIDPRFYDLATALNRGGAFAHYWIPSRDDGQKYSYWYPVNGHVPEPPASWLRQDLYYSVNPAGPNVDRSVHHKTANADVAAVNCLYAEFDAKDWPSEADLVSHVATLQPLPSAIVRSGGGYHAYWLLSETFEVNTPAARQHIDQVETAWVAFVKGDPTVHDLARVLRVPGSQNYKYSPPRDVSFVRFEAGCVYELPELIDVLTEAGAWPPVAKNTAAPSGVAAVTSDDHELLELAHNARNGAEFDRLWAGDTSGHGNDHSKADLALCALLAFWTQKDESRMDRLFRQSGLMRPKWDRDEYRERTIELACKSVTSVYNPAEPTDQGAIDAAMSAVDTAPPGAGTPPAQPAQAQGQPQPASNSQKNGGGKTNKKDRDYEPTQADLAYKLASGNVKDLFCNSGTSWAIISINGHTEATPVTGKIMRGWLGKLYFKQYQRVLGSQAMQDALNLLAYDAIETGKTQPVYMRIANLGDRIYIDLGDPAWTAVEIDKAGWRLTSKPPVAFRRPRNMLPLPMPQQGTLDLLWQFLNLDTEDKPLVAAWILAAMGAIRPCPILCFVGQAGTAKSTDSRVLKRLIDPSNTELRPAPRETLDIAVAANNAWLLAYDNLTYVNEEISDLLCQVSTGSTFSTRQLYENFEEATTDVSRPALLNSIGDIVDRPDLLDRSIVLSLPILPPDTRLSEQAFWADYAQAAPFIFGGLLTALSGTLAALPSISSQIGVRMADFARWGMAAEKAGFLGTQSGEFLKLYEDTRQRANRTLAEGSILAEPLQKWVDAQANKTWQGTSKQLLECLNLVAGAPTSAKTWPATARKLTQMLRNEATAFRTAGLVNITERIDRSKVTTWLCEIP